MSAASTCGCTWLCCTVSGELLNSLMASFFSDLANPLHQILPRRQISWLIPASAKDQSPASQFPSRWQSRLQQAKSLTLAVMKYSKETDSSHPGKFALNLVVAPAQIRFINIDEHEFPSQSEI